MEAVQQPKPPSSHKLFLVTRMLLHSASTTLWNIAVLIFPVALLVQGLYWVQQWLFHPGNALYFHPYADTATTTAFILLLMFTFYLYGSLLRAGRTQWRQTIRKFLVPLILSLPLGGMVMDSYIAVTPQGVVHSDFWSLGDQTAHSWQDVEWISVTYQTGHEQDHFTGSYYLHFRDGTALEIWNRANMSTQDLVRVDRLATAKGIPFRVLSPLTPEAKQLISQDWTQQQSLFIQGLYAR
ncbi:hypothetical protein GCM10011571_07740 [Marinithermofilum abyssi]|uniref:Uncharacterized protein n=1 Tax=Marinithermofilum abyssi TaxID=1571185 RepID=A0A8J2VFH0_9BACL|nr:hypothetical protein [Marinithermofilum abyssi]GGE08898.1 hypothetical protein GCM10011571_07740 [Marinithermofilum abyssi]